MTKEEATARLCKLMAEINGELTAWKAPADCICAGGGYGSHYQNDGTAIEFIEHATRAAMSARKKEGS